MKRYIAVVVVLIACFMIAVAFAGPNSVYTKNTTPWTYDGHLSAATTTGTSKIIYHDSPMNSYSCFVTSGGSTANFVNIDLDGSIDGVNYYSILNTRSTWSINVSTSALQSAGSSTYATTPGPILYTRTTYSVRSGGTTTTSVTANCLFMQ